MPILCQPPFWVLGTQQRTNKRDKVIALTGYVIYRRGADINGDRLLSLVLSSLQNDFIGTNSFDFHNNVLQMRKQKLKDFNCFAQDKGFGTRHMDQSFPTPSPLIIP